MSKTFKRTLIRFSEILLAAAPIIALSVNSVWFFGEAEIPENLKEMNK